MDEYCEAEEYADVLRLAQSMEGQTGAWSYLNRIPLDLLVQHTDLTVQCFLYNLANLDSERCRQISRRYQEECNDPGLLQVIQALDVYLNAENGIQPSMRVLPVDLLKNVGLGPVSQAMILVGNSTIQMEKMLYDEAEYGIELAVQTCSGANMFVTFFAYNQLAQVYEETGNLNKSLSCYAQTFRFCNAKAMISGIKINYFFGLAGVLMRRMELLEAGENIEKAASILRNQRYHLDIADITLQFHQSELLLLSGNIAEGQAGFEKLLNTYPTLSLFNLGRLVWEFACEGCLDPSMSSTFLRELGTDRRQYLQPFLRLLRARLLAGQGKEAEAMEEVDDVLAISRLKKNKLRLVEAGLLKIHLLTVGKKLTSEQREVMNLLREAIHYASADCILLPFYLERSVLLVPLSAFSSADRSMSKGELTFLRRVWQVCGYDGICGRLPEQLSVREQEVLEELALGITNKEIADRLCISLATVKTHVLSIFGKLGVSSRLMAV
ncbi:MAG: LuxR C-terminal-related transcriptional regulator [Spirochaetia bacterium]|jgi:LuxR family maltose regulon positive regulatory protein|nr:LuxR C-terminal-related transcriptional regulator [Spirochaetia bacterium]